ncbi:MAG: hypothetical protein LC770_05310 [Acidobacteria bacterium]|nr:hypothetical protein [Acidobacteriota bacterium]MCA1600835.1 hypothetical protein [Acidobacteriota bacterium]
MRIDIDGLTEAELIDLNNRVVERLKFLNHMRAHAQMLEFRIGDRVSFQPESSIAVRRGYSDGSVAEVALLTIRGKPVTSQVGTVTMPT